ncbi:unnamed protein product, partial [marine sediment metagenome]
NENVHIFPFGVNEAVFSQTAEKKPEKNKCPTLGYIGGIHRHVDVGLLKNIAKRNRDWKIILVGPMQINEDTFKGFDNVELKGKKELAELPAYISGFDICLIPYVLNEYTKTVYPTKLNEYLMMGKPVVSTSIPEVDRFNEEHAGVIEVAKTEDEFIRKIEKSLKEPFSEESCKRRQDVARQSNWPNRIAEMSYLMEKAIEKRHNEKTMRWREEMTLFYKKLKGKTLKLALGLILLYVIIFRTSFVWFLASPLKISETPQRCDAIAVFGGGVGESGSPGKSTIERARFGADLYNEGFAKHIIFSSGYTHKYNDAENMKLIALSMGVPAGDIILDKKGDITYKNVKYTAEIVRKNNFHKIILVSSPYNMRRSSLVFNSIAKDIDVAYVPVPSPQFYQKSGPVKLAQIKAIMHEYLGIVYYWFKGYIKLGREQ